MAKGLVTKASRNNGICLPICEKEYETIIDDAQQFRHFLDCSDEKISELFPSNFLQRYQLKDKRMSL